MVPRRRSDEVKNVVDATGEEAHDGEAAVEHTVGGIAEAGYLGFPLMHTISRQS